MHVGFTARAFSRPIAVAAEGDDRLADVALSRRNRARTFPVNQLVASVDQVIDSNSDIRWQRRILALCPDVMRSGLFRRWLKTRTGARFNVHRP
jgi:hypothetical protein